MAELFIEFDNNVIVVTPNHTGNLFDISGVVLVDNTVKPPESHGVAQISYEKSSSHELWEKKPGSSQWSQILTGQGEEESGTYEVRPAPGERYIVGIFEEGAGPLSDPQIRFKATVTAILKQPVQKSLIIADFPGEGQGGTFHHHSVDTNVLTSIVVVGASRTPADIQNGIPILRDPDGRPTLEPATTAGHFVELKPLVPGNRYEFTIMVVDAAGNWDVLQREFITAGRKVTVQFTRMLILNDGDPGTYGEAEFWFRVSAGNDHSPMNPMEDFYRPTEDIDDFSETGRPYSLGFAYIESVFNSIPADRTSIWVSSWAHEHDGPFDGDEAAGNFGMRLNFPDGLNENVSGRTVRMDCPVNTTGDDFHYQVDVTFSVEYR